MGENQPSPRPPAPWRHAGRLLLPGLAWLALTVIFFEPALRALDGDLDPSIFSAYAYYTAHGFQYGPEVVAMAGPYGFIMYGVFYGGELFWVRFVAEIAFAGVFAAQLLWFFSRLPKRSWVRWSWFPAHILFTVFLADLAVAWAMLLIGWFLLEPKPAGGNRRGVVALAALLGYFALCKGTHLFLALATIGVVTTAWVLQRQGRQALLVAGSFLAGLLGFWLLARQNPLNLPAYLAGTWHLAAAYNSAMSMGEPAEIFWRGTAMATGFLAALGWTAWLRRREIPALAGLALLGGFTFVMWKHGFVRADNHTVIFFSFASVAVIAWCLQFFIRDATASPLRRLNAVLLATVLLLVALAGAYSPLRPSVRHLAAAFWPTFRHHLTCLVHPFAHRAELEAKLKDQRDLNQLPTVAETINRQPVDYFGYQQGILMLNGLNYRPRPMGAGTFNVYDPYLMQLNRDFLRDPARRPEYYLVKPGSIDNRFVTQDDGLALQELLQGWRPEAIEQNLLLMKAVPGAPAPAPATRSLGQKIFHFDEAIEVPAVRDDEMLVARFVFGNSWLGGVRNALYKQPPVAIALRDRAGAPLGDRRLVPVMAASPFIFSPLVDETMDLLDLYGRTPGRQVGSFTLSSPGATAFTRRITVEFSAVPRPPALDPYVLRGMKVRFTFPLANVIPEFMTPAFKTHNVVRYVHAPSEIIWPLSGAERELAFQYGIDPRAYEEGTTNGVEFIVEVRGPAGGVTKAWSRLLQPKTVAADRGKQSISVQLPIYAPGSRVVLRTDPGEYGDTAWDWSYVTQIDFRQGRFTAEQFPNFNRVPDAAEDEHASVLELEGKKILMLHVPGVVGFTLAGHERRLALDFGFLPGAYTGDGKTQGADYIVELTRAGQPAREIFRRTLRPLSVTGDQGGQTAALELPAVAAGDVLSVRTAPIAGGSPSWGWTYVSHLVID